MGECPEAGSGVGGVILMVGTAVLVGWECPLDGVGGVAVGVLTAAEGALLSVGLVAAQVAA